MRRLLLTAATATALFALAGCSTPLGADEDPVTPPVAEEAPCVVGTWALDVADYASQAERYVLGLGIPIDGFAMTGAGTITFTDDGLVATDVDLTTTGTIVAGDTTVPLNQQSVYTASGDWSVGSAADTIDLANWANVPDPAIPVDPAAPPIPAIDYTDIPTVSATCSSTDLVLQAPGAPLAALWHR